MALNPMSHAALAIALLFAPVAAAGQAVVQPIPGTTDADRLGDEMRRVGADPRNVDALLNAGELSLKLGDLSGAASLFARAEKVDPRSGRLKAGMAAILVRSERPGEALRYFAQAQALGFDPRRFAGDRALAYDLIGEQARAQRDYRTALQDTPGDDEVVRRYALSLAISGQQAPALAALDPLVRRQDRGAWRARAFVMAMTGNVPEAARIAQTMMPGLAGGLQPFFERLPTLPAADRAFAVHFGEVRPTPERIADARLTPVLPAFVPDPVAPVALAAVRVAPESSRDRRRREQAERTARRDQERAQAAAARAQQAAARNRGPTQTAALARTTTQGFAPPVVYRAPATVAAAPVAAPPAVVASPVATGPAAPVLTAVAPVVVTPVVATPTPAPVQVAAAQPVTIAPPPAQTVTVASVTPATDSGPSPTPGVPTGEPPARIGREDSILARIVAGLSIPASELGVVTPARATRAPAAGAERVVAVADAKEARDAAAIRLVAAGPKVPLTRAERRAAARKAATEVADETPAVPLTRAERRAAARKAAADALAAKADETPAVPLTRAERRAADRKAAADAAAALTPAEKRAAAKLALADKKAAADRKAAADKKALADKEAAEEKRVARSNPSRIWVQVAGGANEDDLPKAWGSVKAKSKELGGRTAYTTPLRATNRVLTGPFKTDAEARSFVNQLKKDGVSAFAFTSDAGQPVKRLPTK